MRGFVLRLKRLVFGSPVSADAVRPDTFRTPVALAVFGAGILSAVMYAPDAVIDALRNANQQQALPALATGVVVIMVLLGGAYASQVRAFPSERGDYGVVRDRLGRRWGVLTGASLLVDYLFTVAVSVAALTAVFTYLIPELAPWSRVTAVSAIAVLTFASLRRVRERIRAVVAVWYGFLAAIIAVVVTYLVGDASGEQIIGGSSASASWPVLVAYAGAVASGAVMLTGIEHLASSGPHHEAPSGRRTALTLGIAIIASASAFWAVADLGWRYAQRGWEGGPILLQGAFAVSNSSIVIWLVGLVGAGILYAAAVAVSRRFSRLTSFLASDGFLPRQLAMRNDRLVLRGGVLMVGAASGAVVLIVGADLAQLIHMYIVGVFTAIFLSQVAMLRWTSNQLALATVGKARVVMALRRLLHLAAGLAAGAVLLVTAVFNFANGAWFAIALIVALMVLMHAISRHYARVKADLAVPDDGKAAALPSATHGLVLVAQLHRPALRALSYAKAARHSTLKAVSVQIDKGATVALQKRWVSMRLGVPLVVVESPYRDLVGPMLEYVKNMPRSSPRDMVVVYVPEYIVGRWWEQLLHNRSAARLRAQLLEVPNVVVAAVPWKLESAREPYSRLGPGKETTGE